MPACLMWADVLPWAGDKLLVPVLTGVAVGFALRAAAIPREVNDHEAKAEELNADLSRWMHDRDRQLTADIWRAVGLAKQGVIEDVVPSEPPQELVAGSTPGSQLHSGAFVGRVQRLMIQTLHEYRDDASGKVRAYRAMARSETLAHRALRRMRRRLDPSPLRLTGTGRIALMTWRARQVPEAKVPATVSGDADPTRHGDAADIRPLEQDDGLSWRDAAKHSASP